MRLPENLYKCPDDAWTTPMGIGAFSIRFSEPRRPKIIAHCYDFARELNDKHSRLRKRYEDLEEGLIFLKVCRIRFEDSDDEAMPMGPSLMVPYFQIVFFYLDPDDNTFENRKKTANMVCEDMTIHAAQSWRNHKDTEFWFPKFRFAGRIGRIPPACHEDVGQGRHGLYGQDLLLPQRYSSQRTRNLILRKSRRCTSAHSRLASSDRLTSKLAEGKDDSVFLTGRTAFSYNI